MACGFRVCHVRESVATGRRDGHRRRKPRGYISTTHRKLKWGEVINFPSKHKPQEQNLTNQNQNNQNKNTPTKKNWNSQVVLAVVTIPLIPAEASRSLS